MPNSGTVTAGSVALASQYNNLRSDVLDATTSHVHSGSADAGAKIEGSYLKSTGATNGQVLTANGSGGASFTTLSSSGIVSQVSGTATFSTATSGTVDVTATSGTPYYELYLTGGGTVVIGRRSLDSTSSSIWNRFAYGNTSVVASRTLSNAAAGTCSYVTGGYGFNAGTAFVHAEHALDSATHVVTLRKQNIDLTTTMWSTTLINVSYNASGPSYYGPFDYSGGIRYASGPGIWYGGDYRRTTHAAGTARIASVWVVNDVSGSAYSAPFGSATTTDTYVDALVFIPSSTAATNGTIHAWGYDGSGTARYCTYAVGSASITALSTATAVRPAPLYTSSVSAHPIWLEPENRVAIRYNNGWNVWDRTLTINYGASSSVLNPSGTRIDCGSFDPNTRRFSSGGSWGQFGGADGSFGAQGSALTMDTNTYNAYFLTLLGAGGATASMQSIFVYGNTSGSVWHIPLAGVAKIPFGTTSSTNRQMVIQNYGGAALIAVDAANGFLMNQIGTASPPYTLVAGTGQPYVYVRQSISAFTPPTGNTGWTAGGTANVVGNQITLA